MSRLDSFIRRLLAQRACLEEAARLVAGLPGPIVEIGLGNGRTYDHLRELFPDRPIWVFERKPKPHPACMPPEDKLFAGDIARTLPTALARMGRRAVLVHSDIGCGDPVRTERNRRKLARYLPAIVAKDAVVVSDQPIEGRWLVPLPLPEGVDPGRYFLYRCVGFG
ncbi:MAG: class I SAM-dependent methyltransferase [Geminicoccaceae bacterium]|nr:class I SAM-dependent methyltransferase [Geminicoccaceae bacterium]MCS7266664.1 class I SAM-dependent methyltransferase [Geminicoccaceae bacterium]MDW8340402.1 class I SAM-dependent methyltransferase [Geminicoccaceae bacterium]